MRFAQWVSERGEGEINRIARATELAYGTVWALAHERHVATYRVAKLISDQTEGQVSLAELCEPPGMSVDEHRARKRRQRRRAARARARSAANRGG